MIYVHLLKNKNNCIFPGLFQLGPNVSIGTGVTIGAGVRVRESIILHGATLQVIHCETTQVLSVSTQPCAACVVQVLLATLSRSSSDLPGCYLSSLLLDQESCCLSENVIFNDLEAEIISSHFFSGDWMSPDGV